MDDSINFVDVHQACRLLIDAAEYDMRVRSELEKAGLLNDGYNDRMREIHEQNARLLESFLKDYGWPYPLKFGRKIHRAAWFIAIHAISMPHVLRIACKELGLALKNGEPVAQEYARLYDRISLYEGRGQCYGTQFFRSPNGWYVRDLIDPEQVDARRTQLGLNSFAEGKKQCGADSGGVITQQEMDKEESDYAIFLKEFGWRM